MRRPPSALALVLIGVLALGAACSNDGAASTTSSAATTAPVRDDPALSSRLLQPADLPAGFAASPNVDNTVTAFCAGQDAAARLQASGRAIVGFTRTPAGASVVHLIFRFRTGDAERFVAQATSILGSCSNVPDIRGLAFTYSPSTPAVDASLDGTDSHVSRHGVSVGRANLDLDIAVFRHGDVGELIAALTVSQPREQTDALALSAFSAAVKKATAP